MPSRLSKIISGGQAGADRAAWDAALEAGLEIGGFVPFGREAEDGTIPDTYHGLTETKTSDPAERTLLNVINSDATLVITHGEPTGGTKLTMELAEKRNKPLLHIDLSTQDRDEAVIETANWLESNRIGIVNIAGPRASEDTAIYNAVLEMCVLFLKK